MKCLIVSGGSFPEEELLFRQSKDVTTIIGVDGAAEGLFAAGLVPHVLIGDFDTAEADTISQLEKHGSSIIRLQTEKDITDTEAALEYALKSGADDITILGATGMRTDHTIANIMMLVRADIAGARCRIIDAFNEMIVSCKDITISGTQGQTISILPLTGEVSVSQSGLKYAMDDLKLAWGSSRGISNVMNSDKATLTISGGYALIVKIFK